jgi:hypothetical protein
MPDTMDEFDAWTESQIDAIEMDNWDREEYELDRAQDAYERSYLAW